MRLTCVCITDGYMDGAHISGKGNCLIRNPVGFAAINCFFDDIGYICENRGEVYYKYYLLLSIIINNI